MAVLSDPAVDIEKGLPISYNHRANPNLESLEEQEEEEDLVLVVTNPKLANLIHYTCVRPRLPFFSASSC
jgi:hypothetical protein